MGFSLEEIQKYSQKPSSIPAPGSYGEGQVRNIYDMLVEAKKAVQDGKLSVTGYTEIAEPLINHAHQFATASGTQVRNQWAQIYNNGFASGSAPQGSAMVLPFTKQEYAKLPEASLPTQQDIQTGMFNPNLAPLQRIKPAPAAPTPQPNPGVTPQPGTTPGSVVPTNQTGTSPVYTANPNSPAPYGGLDNSNTKAAQDAQRIAQEAALQQQLAVQAANERASSRKKYLTDLSGLITQQNEQTLSERSPWIQEELNAKGLLRSSELGNAIAREQKSLAATSANALGQAGLAAEQQDLGDFKSIQDAYNSARNSALQRQFSVEDYNTQIAAGQAMGAEYSKLTPNQGKAGSPGGAAAGAIIGGLAAGIPTGGAAAPAGITAGASIGNSVGGK